MRYSTAFLVFILIVRSGPIAAQGPVKAAVGKPQPADIKIPNDVVAQNRPLREIFLDVLRGTGVRGGFVEIASCNRLPVGHLEVKEGSTVRQAMDTLVAVNPGYHWVLLDGVVNLMPRGGTPLLSVSIAKFQAKTTDRALRVALQDLLQLPEVIKSEAALGLQPGLGQGGLSAVEEHPKPKQPTPVSINLKSLSLQEALNKVVQLSPDSVWIYHEVDCNGERTFVVEMASSY